MKHMQDLILGGKEILSNFLKYFIILPIIYAVGIVALVAGSAVGIALVAAGIAVCIALAVAAVAAIAVCIALVAPFYFLWPEARDLYNKRHQMEFITMLFYKIKKIANIKETDFSNKNLENGNLLFYTVFMICDVTISLAMLVVSIPYYIIQLTLKFISKAITPDEMKQNKYSHFITKISVLTLTAFIYLQYSKLSDNPISNYFKNLFNKLGIQLNNNALIASLISMSIFAVLFMLRMPNAKVIVNRRLADYNRKEIIAPSKYQFNFFMMLSIAAGPIAYALNTSLPASIFIGLTPLVLMLIVLFQMNSEPTFEDKIVFKDTVTTIATSMDKLRALAPQFGKNPNITYSSSCGNYELPQSGNKSNSHSVS